VCTDLTPAGPKPGGAVTFASYVAKLLGCRTAVLTAAAPDYDLAAALPDGVKVVCLSGEQTTTFENRYDESGNRRQIVHAVGRQITIDDIPAALREPTIVHMAPIVDEIHYKVARAFSHSIIAMTPQGWLRGWDAAGRVYPRRAKHGAELAIQARAVVVSDEDLVSREEQIRRALPVVPYLALTRGRDGCIVHARGQRREFSPPRVTAVDATGAGDTFATAFFIHLYRKGDPWAAANFANLLAARSVTRSTLDGKMVEIERAASEWAS
jgi:sugar/nucleoside kinase (ribokinase family)